LDCGQVKTTLHKGKQGKEVHKQRGTDHSSYKKGSHLKILVNLPPNNNPVMGGLLKTSSTTLKI
jgi:hypothetical protein